MNTKDIITWTHVDESDFLNQVSIVRLLFLMLTGALQILNDA